MRVNRILLAVLSLLCGTGMALATITLKPSIGFGGYYRPGMLTPVAVHVQNNGDTVRGELRVTCPMSGVLPDSYRTQVTIPRGADKLLFLYIHPRAFSREFTVEFHTPGEPVVAAATKRGKELYGQDRLMVVVGGNGSSLSYVNGQDISVPEYPMIRPWDYSSSRWEWMRRQGRGGRPGSPNGKVWVEYADRALLPENPEAYGCVSMLALMSDVTENTLRAEAQQAVATWVASGGHLLVAGGGVASRLDAPFFARLLPAGSAERLTNADHGTAATAPLGAGRVTRLDYDPDMVASPDWRKISAFYGKLAEREPSTPLTFTLREALNNAVMVRNLRPPDLKLIVIFLLVYLVVLVPVNYFVLKKLDARELAWLTTPAIVLVFTVGAYGIGYMTKGHRLIVNTVSVVETAANQSEAEAVSALLIFSPARTTYRMDLGETALLAADPSTNRDDYYNYGGATASNAAPLAFTMANGKLGIDSVRVNMWDFRQFALAHRFPMGGGIASRVQAGQPGAVPRAKGIITNNTPYHFVLCDLYVDGAWAASFALGPKQRVSVEQHTTEIKPALDEDTQHMLAVMKEAMQRQMTGTSLARGVVLIGYTKDAGVPVHVSGHAPTSTLGVVAVHL